MAYEVVIGLGDPSKQFPRPVPGICQFKAVKEAQQVVEDNSLIPLNDISTSYRTVLMIERTIPGQRLFHANKTLEHGCKRAAITSQIRASLVLVKRNRLPTLAERRPKRAKTACKVLDQPQPNRKRAK